MDTLYCYTSSSSSSSLSSSSPPPSPNVFHKTLLPPSPNLLHQVSKASDIPLPIAQPDRFAVHVYLPVPNRSGPDHFATHLNRLNARARVALIGAADKPTLHPVSNHHVSLTRGGAWVRHAHIKTLLRALRDALVPVKPSHFVVTDAVVPFVSENRLRTFLAAVVGEDGPVIPIIRSIDRAMLELGLPVYFEDPRPHMSFTWAEGSELFERLTSTPLATGLQQILPFSEYVCDMDRVCVTIGKETYRISL
jgi:Uncharacterised conserved protein